MTRGQLPKAYLRIDPNIDHTHPDNLSDFIRLLCAANRQPTRGRFRSRGVLDSLFGKTGTDRLYRRRDVIQEADGTVVVPGWDTWQEGDLTVPERMQRLRSQRNSAVTPPSPEPDPPVTPPFPDRSTTSEAARQQGSEASIGLPTPVRAVEPPPTEATRRGKIGNWTPIGLIDWGRTLDKRQLDSWSTFGPEWEPVKAAWIGRGLRFAPSGTAEDNPNDASPSPRSILWSILDSRPGDLVAWINEAPKGNQGDVIRHVLNEWHAVRDAARVPA